MRVVKDVDICKVYTAQGRWHRSSWESTCSVMGCIQNPTQSLAEEYDNAESGYKKLIGWSKMYFFCGLPDMMGQSRRLNSVWALCKSGSEGKIASGSESDREQKCELWKNSIAERQRNTLMSSLTERRAKVKSKWLFSRQLSCLQQKFFKRRCKRCLRNWGSTRQQGTECSC